MNARTKEPRYTEAGDGAVMDGLFGVRFLCVNDHNGGLAAELLNRYDSEQIRLAADAARLREALDGMIRAYAPRVEQTVAREGIEALHPAVREARAALAGKDGSL